jgi:leader peptidase (prepilin peptidase)/N-methyltransferase
VTFVLVGAVGFLLGIIAHDLAIQALDASTPLRPLLGTCPRCRSNRGWARLRCPNCRRPATRELVVATTSAATALTFELAVGFDWVLVPYLGFLLLSTALVITDLEAFRIVDRLNLPGTSILTALLAAVSLVGGDVAAFLRGLGGAAAYFAGASLLFIVVRGRGFGAGDVKLAVSMGLFTAYLGWSVLGWAVFGTAMIGGAVALILVVTRSAGRKTELPYGPPMILGAWTAIAMVGVGAIPVPT